MSQPFAATPTRNPGYPDSRADSVNLAQIWHALKRHRHWIILPTLLAFAGSLLFVNIVPARYTGEAKVLLESRESFYTRPGSERVDLPTIDEQAVASQVQVILSRDLGREAVRRLGLVGHPEFDPLVHGIGPVRRLLILLGLASNPYDYPPEERVLDNYYDRLLVYTIGRSRVLAIEFRSKDPDLAARGANTVADLYLNLQEAAKKDTARSASTWLGPAIDQLRTRVAQAEAKVEEFRSRMGLFVGGGTGATSITITQQQLSDLNAQLAQARSVQADAQAKARLIRDMIRTRQTIEIPDVANNELIRRLTEQSVNLRTQLALESRTLLPQHPRIKELNAQLADLEIQIRNAAERTVRTLENEARIAGSRVETLQAAVDAQKKVAATSNENEVQLRALEREARAEREQLESYLVRYREALARDVENATPADARIVSRAAVPQVPSFPKKVPIIALVTLATLILAIGTVIGRELLGSRAMDMPGTWVPAPVGTEQMRQPMMSVSGRTEAPSHGFPSGGPGASSGASAMMAAAAAATGAKTSERYNFQSLVARLSKSKAEGRGRRVLVTSVDRALDATDMAKGLGRMLSGEGRAILVSLDAAPDERSRGPGLTDLVGGDASFSDIIEREAGLRLHTVPVGKLDIAVLHKDAGSVDLALSAFDQTYDWVICVLRHSREEALLSLFAPRVDAVVIASNADPASGSLVDLYEKAKTAGAPDVVVAREQAPAAGAETA